VRSRRDQQRDEEIARDGDGGDGEDNEDNDDDW
jgi:hypothetical protein